jgi:hypothetical protein
VRNALRVCIERHPPSVGTLNRRVARGTGFTVESTDEKIALRILAIADRIPRRLGASQSGNGRGTQTLTREYGKKVLNPDTSAPSTIQLILLPIQGRTSERNKSKKRIDRIHAHI